MVATSSRRGLLAAALGAIIFAGGFIFGAKHVDNYFPLQEGLTLEYAVKRTKDGAVVEQIKQKVTNLAQQTLDRKRVVPRKYEMAGVSFMGYFSKDSEGVMFLATKGEKDPKPVVLPNPFYYLKDPLKVGEVWGTGDGPKGRIESVSDTVVVPAGAFKECVKVKITYPATMPMKEGYFWFAEKIGIVQSAYIYKDAMREEFQLISMKE
ncbi:MAG: hypothetical protein FJ128_01560 [Deltaproteobacteria bacterium]|nr:hypothetical protein [Deltaproteobacteria bacterium]